MTSERKIRVILADDHKLVRAGIRALLQTVPEVQIVAEAEDGRQAVQACAELQPDIVLMDIMMPNLNGLDATVRIVRMCPDARVIILSMNADEDSVLKSFRAGAVGYLVKNSDPAELGNAIAAVMRGASFLSAAVSQHLIRAYTGHIDKERTSLERLSPRQREVLQLIAEGNTTKEIAARLNIGARTAEAYRGDLMKALDIHDVASLTRYAIRVGLVSADR